jgi:hypothetical protein
MAHLDRVRRFSRARRVDRFLHALRSDVTVHLLRLWAPLATVAAREAIHPDRKRFGGRVAECWHELAANLDELGVLIDALRPVNEVVGGVQLRLEGGTTLLGHSAVAA